MSELRDAVEEYLKLRRTLGSQLRGVDRVLRSFVAFAEREGASHIATDLALRWAQEPVHVQPATWAWRLRTGRRFAAWRSASDPRPEAPPAGLLPHRHHRQGARIYSEEESEK